MVSIRKIVITLAGLALSLAITGSAVAELYKGLDEEGNVVYSDKPFKDSESITPPPLSVMDATKVEKSDTTAEEPEEDKPETTYSVFSILSPASGETIWNNPNLAIQMKLSPDLAIKEGHSIWMFMDGRPVIKNSGSPTVQIGRAYRGEHTFEGQVRNKKGDILKRTPAIKVYIKQSTI